MRQCVVWSLASFALVVSFAAWGQDASAIPPAPGGDAVTMVLTELLRAGGFPAVVVAALAWFARGAIHNFTLTVRFSEDDRKLLERAANGLSHLGGGSSGDE